MIFYKLKQFGFAQNKDCSFHFEREQLKINF